MSVRRTPVVAWIRRLLIRNLKADGLHVFNSPPDLGPERPMGVGGSGGSALYAGLPEALYSDRADSS